MTDLNAKIIGPVETDPATGRQSRRITELTNGEEIITYDELARTETCRNCGAPGATRGVPGKMTCGNAGACLNRSAAAMTDDEINRLPGNLGALMRSRRAASRNTDA